MRGWKLSDRGPSWPAFSTLKRFDVAIRRMSVPVVVLPKVWWGVEEGRHTSAWEHKYRFEWCNVTGSGSRTSHKGTVLWASSSYAINTSGIAPAALGCEWDPFFLCCRTDDMKLMHNMFLFCDPIKHLIKEHHLEMNSCRNPHLHSDHKTKRQVRLTVTRATGFKPRWKFVTGSIIPSFIFSLCR